MSKINRKRITAVVAVTSVLMVLLAIAAWYEHLDGINPDGPTSVVGNQRAVIASVATGSKRAEDPTGAISKAPRAIVVDPPLRGDNLPPKGTPWHLLVSELMARAQAGDRPASDRLYDDTFGCIQYVLTIAIARDRLNVDSDTSSMSAAQIARELDGYDAWQSILNDNDATCSQATRSELYRRMYPILLAAAKNGNEMAAACYASGPYTQPGGDEKDNRADLTAWASNALDLMRAGVRRGDWAMVDLLQAYFDPLTQKLATTFDSKWQARQFQSDPLMAYRYAALWALGAQSSGGDWDRSRAKLMLSEYKKRFDFSDAQVQEVHQWAKQTYQRHFVGKAWLGGPTITNCTHGKSKTGSG